MQGGAVHPLHALANVLFGLGVVAVLQGEVGQFGGAQACPLLFLVGQVGEFAPAVVGVNPPLGFGEEFGHVGSVLTVFAVGTLGHHGFVNGSLVQRAVIKSHWISDFSLGSQFLGFGKAVFGGHHHGVCHHGVGGGYLRGGQ